MYLRFILNKFSSFIAFPVLCFNISLPRASDVHKPVNIRHRRRIVISLIL